MKRFFVLVLFCSIIYSCKPGIPKNIIQPDQMEKVLFDIHVVDGYMSSLTLPTQDTAKFISAPLYKGVYKKFKIDSALYNKSLDYYYQHPDVLKKMYDNITLRLTKEKARLERTNPPKTIN